MIYIIKSGDKIKIGKTSNMDKRLMAYKTHNPDIHLIKTYDYDDSLEQYLHNYYKDYRITGEWFNILDKIDDLDKIVLNFPKIDETLCDVERKVITKRSILDLGLKDVATRVALLCIVDIGISNSVGNIINGLTLNSKVIANRVNINNHRVIKDGINDLISKKFLASTKKKDYYKVNPLYINRDLYFGVYEYEA